MSTQTHAKLIRGADSDWEVVVGLEVHAQVTSRAKLFSGASTAFGGEPNTHVSLVDAAMPGMLPVINRKRLTTTVRMMAKMKRYVGAAKMLPAWRSPRRLATAMSTITAMQARTR